MIKKINFNGEIFEPLTLDQVYRVGMYFVSDDPTSPASLFGGQWVELDAGTFLMAAGLGGTASGDIDDHGNPNGMHTMTVEELASHNHHQQYSQDATMGYFNTIKATTAANNAPLTASYDDTTTTGGSKPFDIRPPTVTVHIWRRTA